MDTVLLITTIASLTIALASGLAVRRMKRSDQERTEARVAALAAAAAGGHEATAANRNSGEWKWNGALQPRVSLPQHVSAPPRASTLPPVFPREEATRSEPFFGTVQREEHASGRFALIGAAALVLAVVGTLVIFTTSGHETADTATVKAVEAAPIELVSLGHSRDASTLTIKGVVRNPMTGPTLEGLTAVVSLIGNDGELVSTKDVPLDYRALGPGEEAPFRVNVPDPGSVAKYRVSFRAGTDVVAHVDRRSDTKLVGAL